MLQEVYLLSTGNCHQNFENEKLIRQFPQLSRCSYLEDLEVVRNRLPLNPLSVPISLLARAQPHTPRASLPEKVRENPPGFPSSSEQNASSEKIDNFNFVRDFHYPVYTVVPHPLSFGAAVVAYLLGWRWILALLATD